MGVFLSKQAERIDRVLRYITELNRLRNETGDLSEEQDAMLKELIGLGCYYLSALKEAGAKNILIPSAILHGVDEYCDDMQTVIKAH